VLRLGRQYVRPISNFGAPFAPAAGGELIAWSRVLDDEEALCIVNGNGRDARGGDVIVDAGLNRSDGASFQVTASSAQAAGAPAGAHRVGDRLPVQRRGDAAFVAIRDVPASEVLVLINRP
jgi:hypothetical protein